jgi:hypothetical protein
MGRATIIRDVRKLIAYDEAIAKLQEAGLAEAFMAAVEKDPELLEAINKLAPNLSGAASPGWSCCVTVSNPLRSPGGERINPAVFGSAAEPSPGPSS